jgi:hypothetical protein
VATFFSFPVATLEKAIQKRIMTLPPQHREWFAERWLQKPYKKSFIEKKAMPLVILLSKGKNWDDALFAEEMAAWDAKFYAAEAEVLYPFVTGDGLLKLMQKNMPAERLEAIRLKLDTQRHI